MKMKIEIDVHVPERDERNAQFIEAVIDAFKTIYPDYETEYRPDSTPRVTVSFWNEDGTPYKMTYSTEQEVETKGEEYDHPDN